jgi:hypothetical protein
VVYTEETLAMMEFRWVVVLTLWTLLIGPIVDLSSSGSTGQQPRSKDVQQQSRAKNAR